MTARLIPEGYEPLACLAARYGLTENAIRIMAARRQVRAVMIRNKIHVHEPDLVALCTPRPYPPAAA
jgi:hypothetical protein